MARVPKPISYRKMARQWRDSSKRRCVKLGREVELPSIDEVHAHLERLPLNCEYCLLKLGPFKFNRPNLDHRMPISRGGSAGTDNLALTCGPCNRAKGEMTDEEFCGLRALVATWADGGKNLFVRLRMSFWR